MRRLPFLTTIVLLLDLAGCGGGGPKLVPVQGKLTSKDRPLDNTDVWFLPASSTEGEGGVGRSDDSGTFTLVSLRSGDKGVLPGKYKVRVSRRVTPDGKPLPPGATRVDYPDSRETIPELYTSRNETPLRITIPETGGEVKIDVPVKIQGRN